MSNIEISFTVKLKSGAEVTLSEEQTETLTRWTEGLLFQGVPKKEVAKKEEAPRKKTKYKRSMAFHHWTQEDDAKLLAFLKENPPTGKVSDGRIKKIKLLAQELNHTIGATKTRLSTLNKKHPKDGYIRVVPVHLKVTSD